MEKGVYVKDIKPALEIRGVFVIASASLNQSRNGPYWRLALSDVTGAIEAKIWSPKSQDYTLIPQGSIALASGRASLYREQLQLTIENFELLAPEQIATLDQRAFMPCSQREPEDMLAELKELAQEVFTHKPWQKFFLTVINDPEIRGGFLTCPGAKSIHHAWIGGLLEHSLGVATLCQAIASNYPQLDSQTLVAGAIFHDIGKIREYSYNLAIDYTTAGSLHGHIYLGLEMLGQHLDHSRLSEDLKGHFKHLVLSHHGEYEFGACRLPQTAEAFALHYADILDARMGQCKNAFEDEASLSDGWSCWQKTLDRRLYKASPTPASGKKEAPPVSCLSLLKE